MLLMVIVIFMILFTGSLIFDEAFLMFYEYFLCARVNV